MGALGECSFLAELTAVRKGLSATQRGEGRRNLMLILALKLSMTGTTVVLKRIHTKESPGQVCSLVQAML